MSITHHSIITRRCSMQQQRRSRLISGLLALGLLAGAALTAGPAQAVDAVGPYYALPSWDKKMGAANRFVVLTNWASAAVLDKETGLVWERSPAATGALWGNALSACTTRTTGNHKGWRLPSVHELQSLIDPAHTNPALPTGHPFTTVQTTGYWSATTVADAADVAWSVGFGDGGVGQINKGVGVLAWCVRGGMNAAAY
jgi:hypothetical protein